VIEDILITMLWSISPLGEAKVGIPIGLQSDVNPYVIFIVAFVANVLVFPVMIFFLNHVNRYFLRFRSYKKGALWVARRAKKGAKDKIQKYGFWGLMLFVMIPVPGTGVYAGTIATYLFNIERKQAFAANTIGIFFSSVIVWLTFYYGSDMFG